MKKNPTVHGELQGEAAIPGCGVHLRVPVWRYLRNSRFFVLLTGPVIWMCLPPIILIDLIGSIYQKVCFPIYGIPRVNRNEYVIFDRHRLRYLNFIEKLNCEYCAYVNGILAYFSEIAARTEQHWCPIKHAGCAKCEHSRYRNFVEYGDSRQYRGSFNKVRNAFDDIMSQPGPVPGKADGGTI